MGRADIIAELQRIWQSIGRDYAAAAADAGETIEAEDVRDAVHAAVHGYMRREIKVEWGVLSERERHALLLEAFPSGTEYGL